MSAIRNILDLTNIQRYQCLGCERRYLIIVTGGIILTISLINFVLLSALGQSDANLGYEVIDRKWSLAQQSHGQIDVLVLGDSSGDQGVDPSRLKQKYGKSGLNLCTFGDMLLVDDVWLLQTYLQSNPPPSQIVLVHVYDVWSRTEVKTGPLRHIPIRLNDWDNLAPLISLDWQWKISVLIDGWCPIYSRRESLKYLITSPRAFFEQQQSPYCDGGFRKVTDADLKHTRADRNRHIAMLAKQSFTPSPLNQQALQTLLKLTAEHKVPMLIVNSPLDEQLAEDKAFAAYYAQLQFWLLQETKPFPNVAVYADVFPVNDNELERVDHVTFPAAQRYTDFIMQVLGFGS